MKYPRIIMLFLLGSVCGAGAAAEAPAPPDCSAPEYRQFDFWVGEWEVYANDQLAGHNTIKKVYGDCVLRENWRGRGGITGGSWNIYDRISGRWHQSWVDSSGTLLLLDGGLEDGNMVMRAERPSPNGGTALHRITWTPLESGHVRQHWETSNDGGAQWQTLFDGEYRRKSE